MTTKGAKALLSRMKLKNEAVRVVVANDGQGLSMTIDFSQLNEKYV